MSLRDAIPLFDVRDWLSERTRVYRSGPTNVAVAECPICAKKRPKFYARADASPRNGSYTAYCCHNSGSLVSLVALAEGLDDDAAIDFIRARVEGEDTRVIPVIPVTRAAEPARAVVALPDPVYPARSDYPCWIKDRWGTLAERGVDAATIARHDLRLTWQGTVYGNDRREDLDGRLLVPVFQGGALLSWQARDLTGTSPRKYLFPAGDRSSEWLYDLDAHTGDTLLICEGVFHKWAWDRLGRASGDAALERVAVASFGKKLTQAQMELLVRRPGIANVVLAWDLDAAPEIAKVARELVGKKRVYVMPAHPSGRDHDELDAAELAALWRGVEVFTPSLEVRMKTSLALARLAHP